MISEIFHDAQNDFRWIDVTEPTQEEIDWLAQFYHLHPAAVKDCLSPMHLPKCERIGEAIFMILRTFDQAANNQADEIRELTNKVAIFSTHQFVITIHRQHEPFLDEVIGEWKDLANVSDPSRIHLLNHLIDTAIYTFEEALKHDDDVLDRVEVRIFENSKDKSIISDLYIVKRRASVFKRMLFLTKSTLETFRRHEKDDNPFTTDLIESTDALYFTSDSLHENANNLINLHISLASHRSNEVMGILTIFSVFFLPLTFIVGLYGMNFRYMPELEHTLGYPAVILTMIMTTAATYIWFKRNKWL